MVSRQAHNLKVAGSNPAPATTEAAWREPGGLDRFRGGGGLGTLLTLNLLADTRPDRTVPTTASKLRVKSVPESESVPATLHSGSMTARIALALGLIVVLGTCTWAAKSDHAKARGSSQQQGGRTK